MEFRFSKTIDKYIYKAEVYFCLFMLCSVCGWFCELICFRIADGIWVNRGFLMGPCLPIYGMGAFAILIFAKKFNRHPLLLFAGAGIMCSIIEFVVASILESAWGLQLWDYSDNILNFRGKVSLFTSLSFALGGLVFVYFIAPRYEKIVSEKIPQRVLEQISVVIFSVMLMDFAMSYDLKVV